MVVKYSNALVIMLLSILLPSRAVAAIVVTWDCNTEADMANYRVEYSRDNGGSWGIEANVDHVPGCQTQQLGITRYIAPGKKLYRLFAGDKSGNMSLPSRTVEFVQPILPIGSPGGQEEAPLPPSPYKPDVIPAPVPPAPTPVPPAPTPPPVAKPGKLSGMQVSDISQTSAAVTFKLPVGTGADIRLSIDPMSWGSATSVSCVESDQLGTMTCQLENLLPGKTYALQGVYYFGIMNQGAIYGELSDIVKFTTLVAPTPPPAPQPPPPSNVTLLEAIRFGLDTCLTKKLAHTACMKALREAVGKVDK